MNVLILHAHWSNRGDEAALRAMIDSLRAALPIKTMSIMFVGYSIQQFPYDDIEILQLYPSFFKRTTKLPRIRGTNFPHLIHRLDALLTILTVGKLSLTQPGRRFLRALDEADIVIHAPGGPSIGDLNAIGDIHYLHRLAMARIVKRRPTFFYAPSMGPFSGWLSNQMRRFVLKRADAIILRDDISQSYLRDQLGLEATVTLDSAFQNEIPEDYLDGCPDTSGLIKQLAERRTVGMVVTDLKWHFKYADAPGLPERLMSSSCEVARHLLDKGYSILLVPQLFGEQDDTPLLERIRDVDPERIQVCPPEMDAYAQQALISRLYAMISMRYHPAIFAAKGNVPFISIYYEHKAKAFAHAAGFSNYALPVEDMTPQRLIDTFEALEHQHSELTARLRKDNPLLRERSRETTRIIVDKLAQLGLNG